MGMQIGLDFGTSNSGAAIFDGRQVHLLPLDPQNVLPEVVKTILYITSQQRVAIGQEAIERYYADNINRFRHYVKKWTGEIEYRGSDMHYMRDVFTYVDEYQPGRLLQYLKTALRQANYRGTQVFERFYNLQDLIAVYLGEIKRRVETQSGQPVSRVMLGRPVQFSLDPDQDAQAEATLRAAALAAGFEQVAFELEPVAAARYYETLLERPQTVLIFDFGGGTLDITILRLGDPQERQVFATAGVGIAGSEFDRAIIEKRLLGHFGLEESGLPPEIAELIQAVASWSALPDWSTPQIQGSLDRLIQNGVAPVRFQALKALVFNNLAFSFYQAVESGKIALSSQGVTTICLQAQNLDLWELYTRSQFERDIAEYQAQIAAILLQTVAASGLTPAQIDMVVKTGGSSYIPLFSTMLEQMFGKEKIKAANTFSSVSAGLAVCAWQNWPETTV